MTRTCGTCTLCCKLLLVRDIAPAKVQNVRCRHQKAGKGCAIYAAPWRPLSCRLWRCWWLMHPVDLPRPDRSHYVIDPTPDFVVMGDDLTTGVRLPAIQIWVDPDYPRAHADPALRAWIMVQAERMDLVAIVRLAPDNNVTLIPPRLSETGDWLELGGRMMTPAEVNLVKRAAIAEAEEEEVMMQPERPQKRCADCEYFDDGDCLNHLAPRFQTKPDDHCEHFFPDTSRWTIPVKEKAR